MSDELIAKIFNSTEGIRHKLGAMMLAKETPVWVSIGMAWFRLDSVTLVLRQPDGTLVLAVPGGGVNVPLTESRRILDTLGIVQDPGPEPPPTPPAVVYVPDGQLPTPEAGHCGKCGKVVSDQESAAPGMPARWFCQCDPS